MAIGDLPMTAYGPDTEGMRKPCLPLPIRMPIQLPPVVRRGTTAPVFNMTQLSLQSWHTCLLLTSLEEGNFPGVC